MCINILILEVSYSCYMHVPGIYRRNTIMITITSVKCKYYLLYYLVDPNIALNATASSHPISAGKTQFVIPVNTVLSVFQVIQAF